MFAFPNIITKRNFKKFTMRALQTLSLDTNLFNRKFKNKYITSLILIIAYLVFYTVNKHFFLTF